MIYSFINKKKKTKKILKIQYIIEILKFLKTLYIFKIPNYQKRLLLFLFPFS